MTNGKYFLDWQVRDAEMRFLAAPRDEKLARARKLARAKFERGDYPMLQACDEVTLEGLAKAILERFIGQLSPESAGAAVPPRTPG